MKKEKRKKEKKKKEEKKEEKIDTQNHPNIQQS
jgi:hypothetical protein